MQVQSLGQEDPLERGMAWQPTSVFLPGESHGQRSLVGCSPWGRKEPDTTEVAEQRAASRGVNRLVKTHQRQTETPESESPTYSQDLHSECESQ